MRKIAFILVLVVITFCASCGNVWFDPSLENDTAKTTVVISFPSPNSNDRSLIDMPYAINNTDYYNVFISNSTNYWWASSAGYSVTFLLEQGVYDIVVFAGKSSNRAFGAGDLLAVGQTTATLVADRVNNITILLDNITYIRTNLPTSLMVNEVFDFSATFNLLHDCFTVVNIDGGSFINGIRISNSPIKTNATINLAASVTMPSTVGNYVWEVEAVGVLPECYSSKTLAAGQNDFWVGTWHLPTTLFDGSTIQITSLNGQGQIILGFGWNT